MDPRTASLEEFHRRMRDGDFEGALVALRTGGFSKVESMFELARAGWLDISQVKMRVHDSDTWRDVRERDEEFHDRLFDALEGNFDATGASED